MKWVKSYWWKLLAVTLVLFSVYIGTSTRVGPGIVRVTPDHVNTTSGFSLTVEGYNTSFDQLTKDDIHVWVKTMDGLIDGTVTEVIDANHIALSFPSFGLNTDKDVLGSASLVVEDKFHGMFLGSEMLRITISPDERFTNASLSVSDNPPQKLGQSYFSFPYRYVLYETIRNLNYHVPMWFTMMTLLLVSFIFSIRYLNSNNPRFDVWANAFAKAGLLFGLMGIFTGMFWANYTWGTPWTKDPKLNGAAVAVLMYIAYQILRGSIDDEDKVARISSVYNIFAYPIFIVLIMVLPKIADFSLHPGAGDSVGFSNYDLNDHLRKVFYPAVLGWILTGTWIAQITGRLDLIIKKKEWND
jgi:heme exporter protein C